MAINTKYTEKELFAGSHGHFLKIILVEFYLNSKIYLRRLSPLITAFQ